MQREFNLELLINKKFEKKFALARSFSFNTFDLGYDIRDIEEVRPATQEEMLSLLVKE